MVAKKTAKVIKKTVAKKVKTPAFKGVPPFDKKLQTVAIVSKKHKLLAEVKKHHKYFWVYTKFPFTHNTINCQFFDIWNPRVQSGELDACLVIPVIKPDPLLV